MQRISLQFTASLELSQRASFTKEKLFLQNKKKSHENFIFRSARGKKKKNRIIAKEREKLVI